MAPGSISQPGTVAHCRDLLQSCARRQPAVIASITSVAVACAAKAATMSVPIVFEVAGEPAEAGVVKNLA